MAASDSGVTSGGKEKKNVNSPSFTVDATTQGTFHRLSNESTDSNFSDHEYLGGKGRMAKRGSAGRNSYQRRKKHMTSRGQTTSTSASCTSSSDMDMADEAKSSTSTNEPANYDSSHFPNYKVLTMPGYGNLGIRAIQSTSRISGVQAPILVGCIQDDYTPESLPKEIEELEFLVQIKGAIEDVLCDLILIDYTDREHWVCSEKLSDEDYNALLEKYPKLTDSDIAAIESIKTGFVNPGAYPPISLGKGVGREALQNILLICRDILRNKFPTEHLSRTLKVSNIGGRAPDYTGNCVIATYDDLEDLPEETALDFLDECRLPSNKRSRRGPKNVKVYTPDLQVCSQHLPIRDFCFLTADVKSKCVGEEKSNNDILQSWMQSLIGLKRSDTAYAVLLTPEKGIIIQIQIEAREGKKYKRLATRKKVWKFTGDTKATGIVFQTKMFIEFVSAIAGIMLKHKDDVVE